MPAIRHLDGLRGTTRCRFGVEAGAVAGDHPDAWMRREPGGDVVRIAIREDVHEAMRVEVDHGGSRALPALPGPIVDPNRSQVAGIREGKDSEQPQQRGGAGRHPQPDGQARSLLRAQHESDLL